jgi:hypothetical protein
MPESSRIMLAVRGNLMTVVTHVAMRRSDARPRAQAGAEEFFGRR